MDKYKKVAEIILTEASDKNFVITMLANGMKRNIEVIEKNIEAGKYNLEDPFINKAVEDIKVVIESGKEKIKQVQFAIIKRKEMEKSLGSIQSKPSLWARFKKWIPFIGDKDKDASKEKKSAFWSMEPLSEIYSSDEDDDETDDDAEEESSSKEKRKLLDKLKKKADDLGINTEDIKAAKFIEDRELDSAIADLRGKIGSLLEPGGENPIIKQWIESNPKAVDQIKAIVDDPENADKPPEELIKLAFSAAHADLGKIVQDVGKEDWIKEFKAEYEKIRVFAKQGPKKVDSSELISTDIEGTHWLSEAEKMELSSLAKKDSDTTIAEKFVGANSEIQFLGYLSTYQINKTGVPFTAENLSTLGGYYSSPSAEVFAKKPEYQKFLSAFKNLDEYKQEMVDLQQRDDDAAVIDELFERVKKEYGEDFNAIKMRQAAIKLSQIDQSDMYLKRINRYVLEGGAALERGEAMVLIQLFGILIQNKKLEEDLTTTLGKFQNEPLTQDQRNRLEHPGDFDVADAEAILSKIDPMQRRKFYKFIKDNLDKLVEAFDVQIPTASPTAAAPAATAKPKPKDAMRDFLKRAIGHFERYTDATSLTTTLLDQGAPLFKEYGSDLGLGNKEIHDIESLSNAKEALRMIEKEPEKEKTEPDPAEYQKALETLMKLKPGDLSPADVDRFWEKGMEMTFPNEPIEGLEEAKLSSLKRAVRRQGAKAVRGIEGTDEKRKAADKHLNDLQAMLSKEKSLKPLLDKLDDPKDREKFKAYIRNYINRQKAGLEQRKRLDVWAKKSGDNKKFADLIVKDWKKIGNKLPNDLGFLTDIITQVKNLKKQTKVTEAKTIATKLLEVVRSEVQNQYG